MIKSTPSVNKPLETFWHLSSDELLTELHVNQDEGLTETEAQARLKLYGDNVLKVKKSSGTLKLLLSQFNTPLIYMLLFAAALSLFLYDNTDALIIFGIILISTFLSFIQERGAVKAMEKLNGVINGVRPDIRTFQLWGHKWGQA